MTITRMTFIAALVLAATAVVADGHDGAKAAIEAAVAGEHRTDRYAARDDARHPIEVLSFFGVEPDSTVVEVWPSGGWWTEILAPLLRNEGAYYAAHWPADSGRSYASAAIERFKTKMGESPELYDQVINARIGGDDPDNVPDGVADVVITVRALHNFMADDSAGKMFGEFHRVLKPGGVLGVVQHRGDPDKPQDPNARSGYVTEAAVIAMAEQAGFKLEGSAEINANPKDTRDHPEGVWTLPPSSRLDDTDDGPKYRAIGESDRMTLKFVK